MIFFDVDGTLLDDAVAMAAGLDALYAEYHDAIDVDRAGLGSLWQALLDQHFPRYLRGDLSMEDQRRARMRDLLSGAPRAGNATWLDTAFATYLAGYEQGWTAFPDAAVALSQLSEHALGVITNGNRDQQLKKLKHTRLAGFFTVVVTSEECGAAKPDRRIFLEACHRAGVAAPDAVYVGDSWDADVVGSRNAGLRPLWLRRDPATLSEPTSDTPVIHSLDELPRWLESPPPTVSRTP